MIVGPILVLVSYFSLLPSTHEHCRYAASSENKDGKDSTKTLCRLAVNSVLPIRTVAVEKLVIVVIAVALLAGGCCLLTQ